MVDPFDVADRFDEFDHCVIDVNDIQMALHFYQQVVGEIVGECEITHTSFMSTDEVLYYRANRATREGLKETAGDMPTPHTGVKFGEALIPIFLNQDQVQEPPPEQLRGTPRLALPITDEQMDKAVEVLTKYRIAFEGPVEYAAPCPAKRSIYFKDPSSNFLELSVPRDRFPASIR
jgi:extradiol dioxygenase family protein